jgi:LacI family transcriptional regulator, repressor for deo operon, udp, cdd, tsx, nupC, and nupG
LKESRLRAIGAPRGKAPVTLKDVARDASVSNTTVSRVLTGKESPVLISETTRQRVLDAAARLGYRPNLMARGLRTQRSGTVGVLVADITDPFAAALIPEITSVFMARGYQFLLSHAALDPHSNLAHHRLLGSWVDGLIVLGDHVLGREVESEVLSHHRYVIGVARTRENTMIPAVNVDDTLGIRMAMEHLLALGHRRIGFIGNRLTWDMGRRMEVFLSEMSERGLAVPPDAIALVPHSAAGGYAAASRLLEAKVPLTAMLCAADLLALGALSALHEAGVQVPQGMSVVGFDDIPLAAYATPSLTTVRQPVDALARTAATLLLDAIEGLTAMPAAGNGLGHGSDGARVPSNSTRDLLLAPELIVRRSTALHVEYAAGKGRKSRA